jgi:hypothetical protein
LQGSTSSFKLLLPALILCCPFSQIWNPFLYLAIWVSYSKFFPFFPSSAFINAIPFQPSSFLFPATPKLFIQ